MNTDLSMDETAQVRQKHWAEIRRSPLLLLLALFVIQGLVYAGTYWSMIQIWWRSETFAHGFLIFPISVYLIWSRRHQLRNISDQPDYRGLPFIALCGFIWLLAQLADVLVIQQFAVIAMIPALVWTACGWRKAWAMAFPLSFLLFAVPAGEFLVPSMMAFTADFTVGAVRLTGIPVFREGLYFTLPSGSWSVVEACSGVRYIIASLTLGCLYAYLTYHSYWRRLVFILLALITPVIANGIRAYMIVMIGHLSSMKLAVGVDHLIYGWIWFGVVMFILFWVGSFWRDEKSDLIIPEFKKASPANSQTLLALGLTAFSLLFIWPLWAGSIVKNKPENMIFAAPQSENWQPAELWITDWRPKYNSPSQVIEKAYQQSGKPVGIYLAYYADQHQDAELINANNILVDIKATPWRRIAQETQRITLDEKKLNVIESQLRFEDRKLLVWQWNIINGTHTINNYYAKLLESWGQMMARGHTGKGVVIYTAFTEDTKKDARQLLKRFVNDVLPTLEKRPSADTH